MIIHILTERENALEIHWRYIALRECCHLGDDARLVAPVAVLYGAEQLIEF